MSSWSFNVKHYDGISNTPVIQIASRGLLELMDAGLTEPLTYLNWDDQAFTASHNLVGDVFENPIGVMLYQHTKWNRCILIKLGYVAKAWRGRGVYKVLWRELVKKAQELEAVHIISATHKDNTTMRAVAKSLDRFEESINIKFVVPPK